MPKRVRKWKIEGEIWDYGVPDKFGDLVYATKSQLKKMDDIEVVYKNLKLRRIK